MKRNFKLLVVGLGCAGLVSAMATSFAPGYGGMTPKEQRVTLAIEAGGACQLRNETVMSRDAAEKMVRMMEKFKKMQESMGEEGADASAAPAASTNAVALSDAELATKLRELMTRNMGGGEDSPSGPAVEVQGQTVRLVVTNAFETAAALVEGYEWSQVLWGMPLEALTLANDTNGNLRLMLVPWSNARGGGYLKTMIEQWKKSGAQNEVRIVMPGKILSSSLPTVSDRATMFTFNGTNAAGADALRSLMATSIVVVAESGGLKLSEPVDSRKAGRGRRGQSQSEFSELPLQPASPGYVAEADSAQVTTVYRFPEGTNLLKNNYSAGVETAGVSVQGKLFAPKGRSLLAVNQIKIVNATDDKGRKVEAGGSDNEQVMSSHAYVSSSDREDPSAQLNLALSLPEADAKAIEEVAVEAEVVTVGNWKEQEITNVVGSAGQAVDLSSILPGAKLTVVQRTNKNEAVSSARMKQFNLTLKLEGPREIKSIKVECKSPDEERSNFSTYDSGAKYGKTNNSRQITINGYSMTGEGGPDMGSVKLILKFPDNLRREKIAFKLTGIDLL